MELQKGYSHILILFFVIIVMIIFWEISESVGIFSKRDQQALRAPAATPNPNCPSGDPDDCNDSRDCPFFKKIDGVEVCINI